MTYRLTAKSRDFVMFSVRIQYQVRWLVCGASERYLWLSVR